MTTSAADAEATAFLVMAQNLRVAAIEREQFVRAFRERYDRARDDLRMPAPKLVKIAQEFVRATYRADREYDERVMGSLEEYRRLTVSEDASRY
jgi:hypothetical protein